MSMEKNMVVFQISNSSHKLSFRNDIVVIKNKEFISSLEKSYQKAKTSSLRIFDSTSKEITDIVQVKINMNKVGTFIANFNQKSFNENNGKNLLSELSILKTDNKLSESEQISKILSLVKTLNKYAPLYVSFNELNSFNLDVNKLAKIELQFPLLVFDKKHMVSGKKEGNFVLPTILSFAIPLLGSCAALFGSYNYISGNTFYFAYWISSIILVAAEAFSLKLYLLQNKKHLGRKALILIILFSLLGLGIAFLINKMLLKIETNKTQTIEILSITGVVSLELYLSSLLIAKLLNHNKTK